MFNINPKKGERERWRKRGEAQSDGWISRYMTHNIRGDPVEKCSQITIGPMLNTAPAHSTRLLECRTMPSGTATLHQAGSILFFLVLFTLSYSFFPFSIVFFLPHSLHSLLLIPPSPLSYLTLAIFHSSFSFLLFSYSFFLIFFSSSISIFLHPSTLKFRLSFSLSSTFSFYSLIRLLSI
jgi:hypothetical protein